MYVYLELRSNRCSIVHLCILEKTVLCCTELIQSGKKLFDKR